MDKKYNKARGRLNEELDIVRLIFMLRNLEVTQRVMFQNKERDLLQLQRNQVISSSGDSSGNEHVFFHEKDPMRKIYSHKSEEEQALYQKKLKDMLWSYREKPLTFR